MYNTVRTINNSISAISHCKIKTSNMISSDTSNYSIDIKNSIPTRSSN